MEHIIVLFILALCFFSFFYFLYHVLVKLQNKENFSDEYKLMVASCVVFVFILLFYLKCDIQTKHKCTIRRIYKFIETTRIYI